MGLANRIEPLSIAPSVPRQTPRDEFGAVLADTAGDVVARGAALLGGTIGLGPVPTAAVTGIRSVATRAGPGPGAVTAVGSTASGAAAPERAPQGPFLPGATDAALLEQLSSSDPTSAAFLQLQMRMQQESQQYSAASNVLKVRSDSAKAAINNIR